MSRRLFGLLLFFVLMGAARLGAAQIVPLSPRLRTARADTGTYPIANAAALPVVRRPRGTRLAALRGRSELQYQAPNARPALSLWDRFWRWFWRKIDLLFVSEKSRTTVQWLWYAFMLGTVVWVVLRVLKLETTAVFGRAPRQAPAYTTETAETPFSEDLHARLTEAEAAGNYRLAVRLGYLLALRELADRELVRWLPEKTNQQYLGELPTGTVRDHFARLTRQFEAAWYGEIHPSAAAYATVRDTRAALTRALPAFAPPAPSAP